MKIGIFVDINGFYVSEAVEGNETPAGLTLVTESCIDGFYKAKWNGTAWVEGIDSTKILDAYKQNKIDTLTDLKDVELLSGFTYTNATGTTFYFGYDPKDQEYLHKKATMITLDQTISSVDWKTRDGFFNFSRDEFIKVIQAGDVHEETLVYKLLNLEALVKNATDKATVDSIIW